MTQIGDAERALRRRERLLIAGCAVGLGAVSVWSLWPLTDLTPPTIDSGTVTVAANAIAPIDPTAWHVTLWRPLSDTPPPAPVAAPLTLKLFSILRRADGLTAAIDPGTGGPLVYAKTGQRIGEHLIATIDAQGIEIETNGRRQRLQLKP